MNDIENYIEDLLLLFEESKEIPLTRKIAVDKEELNRIIIEIQGSIPEEIKKAKKISEECDDYIEDAKRSADSIIRQAEITAQRLINEHEVYLAAVEKSSKLIRDSEQAAQTGIVDAMKYVDSQIAKTETNVLSSCELISAEFTKIENSLATTLDLLAESRENLRNG